MKYRTPEARSKQLCRDLLREFLHHAPELLQKNKDSTKLLKKSPKEIKISLPQHLTKDPGGDIIEKSNQIRSANLVRIRGAKLGVSDTDIATHTEEVRNREIVRLHLTVCQ